MNINSLVVKHKVIIFFPKSKYFGSEEGEIITFAGFADIAKITQQINSANFGNILINPYFIFRVRFDNRIRAKMQIKFCSKSVDFLDENSIFNIVHICNENKKNMFLNIFTIKTYQQTN